MNTKNQPQIALVTGANRGIGLEIVRQLAEKEIQVILTGRNEQNAIQAAQLLTSEGLHVIAQPLDVTDEASVAQLFRTIDAEFGRLDILINNAGISLDDRQRSSNADLDTVKAMFETNVFGAWRLCKAFLPLMQRHGYGRIVNISSGLGAFENLARNRGRWPGYSLSKASLNALTVLLAAELQETNILVNAVSPGWVRTDLGGPGAPESVQEGADTPVWLATLPDNGPSGGFFYHRERIAW